MITLQAWEFTIDIEGLFVDGTPGYKSWTTLSVWAPDFDIAEKRLREQLAKNSKYGSNTVYLPETLRRLGTDAWQRINVAEEMIPWLLEQLKEGGVVEPAVVQPPAPPETAPDFLTEERPA